MNPKSLNPKPQQPKPQPGSLNLESKTLGLGIRVEAGMAHLFRAPEYEFRL